MNLLSSSRFWLLLSLAVLPFTINNDSLWLDEGDTALYAQQPTFSAWCQRLLHDGQADCQMPLGMFVAWVGAKVLGTQEWQLRAVNWVWGALALLAMYRVGRRLALPWLPGLLAIQPYFWFYLNEARPYAMQIAIGAWLLVALMEFVQAQGAGTRWAWMFSALAVVLFAATMLAPLPVGWIVLVGAVVAWRQGWRVERRAVFVLVGGFIATLPLAVYYVGTLLRGVRSSQMWAVDWKFVLYVFYELTGMGGVGLSSMEVRALARSPHMAEALIELWPRLIMPALLGLLLLVVLVFGLRSLLRSDRRRTVGILVSVPLLTMAVFTAVSLVLHKAIWARHYAPVFPFLVAVLALAAAGFLAGGKYWRRVVLFALLALSLLSAASFRWSPSLRKEDYRSAAAYARQALADQRTVWWAAGGYSGDYYGLNLVVGRPVPGRIFSIWMPDVDLSVQPPPGVIVLTRPDVHDPDGTLRRMIATNHFSPAVRYQSFVVWTNPAAK